jgi:transcriptional regulator with XRE-family HTH domain
MDIGRKITILKEGAGFKNYKEFGDFVGLPNEWCNDLSKRKDITNVDITRLMRIAEKFNVTIDWLLADVDGEDIIDQYPDDDIATMLSNIQLKLQSEDTLFENTLISPSITKLAYDSIEVVKKLIRQNL